jgi:hypothetical protein
MSSRMPLVIWFLVASFALVFGSLAFMALSEQAIALGSRSTAGVSHRSGQSAVLTGYVFAALAFASLGIPAARNRFRALIWLGLLLAWLALVCWYQFFGSP